MKKFKYIFIIIIALLILLFIPEIFHNYYYNLNYPNDCIKYENKNFEEIFDEFKNKNGYTKSEAASFLSKCKNKNATLLVYYYPIYNRNEQNPFKILPVQTVIYPLDMPYSNQMLNNIWQDNFQFKNNEVKQEIQYYEYWGKKIKNNFNIDVIPIKYRFEK